MTNDFRAESWLHLQELIFENSYDESLGRYRSNYAYRGQDDVCNSLTTSFSRTCGDRLHIEDHLLRNFDKYSSSGYSRDDNLWKLVALAQHHGLPTRLLDWTYSPYVGLHFATSDLEMYDRDGVIWCVNFVKAHELLPESLQLLLQREGAQSFTADLLNKGIHNFEEMSALANISGDYAVFFEPPSLDERIVNQYAFFSVLSNPALSLDDWLDRHSAVYRKITIPKELKWEIRDKLDQSNITERVLFPGLDGLCKWMERHYSTK